MKKLNNKGMTVMELLVSVALISVIMIFMYRLIADVRAEKNENDKITDNIIKISEIEVETINEITSQLSYEKNEIKNIDITKEKNDTGEEILITIKKQTGEEFIYKIGYTKSSEDIFKIYLKNNSLLLKQWSLSQNIDEIEINKKDLYQNKQLVCQFDLLLKSNNKTINNISLPLYFYTDTYTEG